MLSQYQTLLQAFSWMAPSSPAINKPLENQCCKFLQLALGSHVSYPQSTSYNKSLSGYWAQQGGAITPSCIFSPTSTQEVSTAVAILSALSQLGEGPGIACQFAIKSGGHTPWPGAANINGGVTIDMSAISQVTVSADQTITSAGPGARWIDVYLKLDALGLAVPGGRVSEVGVGGLVTGGGLSYFSPRQGFVCDSVVNFEVVLPSGEIVNANATSNSDLWRALKGGSNNFGVVTRIDLKTFPQGKFWGGLTFYPMDTAARQLQAFVKFTEQPSYDVYAALINSYVYTQSSTEWVVANDYVYTQPQSHPPVFQEFMNISEQYYSTLRISNLSDFAIELNGANSPTLRHMFYTATYSNDLDVLTRLIEQAKASVQPVKDVAGLRWALSLQPLPSIISAFSASSGGNSLGLGPKTGNLALVLLTATWNNMSDDVAVTNAVRDLFAQADAYASSKGALNSYIYLNYAYKTQRPIDGYGAASVLNLKAVSYKYDPEQVFQKLVPGGFKLPL